MKESCSDTHRDRQTTQRHIHFTINHLLSSNILPFWMPAFWLVRVRYKSAGLWTSLHNYSLYTCQSPKLFLFGFPVCSGSFFHPTDKWANSVYHWFHPVFAYIVFDIGCAALGIGGHVNVHFCTDDFIYAKPDVWDLIHKAESMGLHMVALLNTNKGNQVLTSKYAALSIIELGAILR